MCDFAENRAIFPGLSFTILIYCVVLPKFAMCFLQTAAKSRNYRFLNNKCKIYKFSARGKSNFDQIAYNWIHCDDSGNSFDPPRTVVRKFHLPRWTGQEARWTERNEFFSFLAIRRRFPVRDLIRTYVPFLCHFQTEAIKFYYCRSLSESFSSRGNYFRYVK